MNGSESQLLICTNHSGITGPTAFVLGVLLTYAVLANILLVSNFQSRISPHQINIPVASFATH